MKTKEKEQKTPPSKTPPPELRLVKHEFTSAERDELGGRLAQSISQQRGVEAELEQMKSAYKARIAECESRIEKLHTDRLNGFEMREKLCRVEFDLPNRKKNFFPVDSESKFPALVERLTDADLQMKLPVEDGKEIIIVPDDGETRASIRLWPTKRNGRPVVAATSHFAIGEHELEERSDSVPCFGDDVTAVVHATKRIRSWLIQKFDVGTADGFESKLQAAIDAAKGVAA